MTTEPNPPAAATDPATAVTADPPTPSDPTPAPAPPASAPTPTPVVASAPGTDVLLLVMLLVLSFLIASFAASNADLWMHLAAGKRIHQGQAEFGVDPFSWMSEKTDTLPQAYWVNHSWLSSWLFYVLYQTLGGGALVVFKAILFTAAIGILSRIGWTQHNRWYVVLCVTMAALAVSGRLFMNPMVISFLFVSITLYVLYRAGLFAQPASLGAEHQACQRCLWYLLPMFALWANLDIWFILGPMLLGIAWGAAGLTRWRGSQTAVAPKTLGLIFGASLLACVINPHHVRVFQLPAELAYLLVTAADAVKLPLPDALVGNGRVLSMMEQADSGLSFGVSSFSRHYWRQTGLGMNIAAVAVAPLLMLGWVAFCLVAFIKSPVVPAGAAPKPADSTPPTLQLTRLLLCVVFLLLALPLYRMIPWFAFIAAPLSAMTLGEFLQWQRLQSDDVERHERGMRFARFVTVPFMLLLLFFAWPGWLHGPFVTNSARRVAWAVRADESMVAAVDSLKKLHEQGEAGNIFNIGTELASYCAWLAPEMKCAFDARYALFVDRIAPYAKARKALIDPNKPASDWEDLFKERKVNQVMHTKLAIGRDAPAMWRDVDHWRPRYVDGSVAVFSWKGDGARWPTGTIVNDWNRRAFGDVPTARRPPVKGSPLPETAGLWDLFLDGTGRLPAHLVGEVQILGEQYQNQQDIANYEVRKKLGRIFASTVASVAVHPEGGLYLWPSLGSMWMHDVSPPDKGAPALPILMIRAARQAVALNPQEVATQSVLIKAEETLFDSQDYWVRHTRGFHPPGLRDHIRQLQQVASLVGLAQLHPDNFLFQVSVAKVYEQNSLYDLALDHLRTAEMILESGKTSDKTIDVRKVKDVIAGFERRVRQRQTKLQEKSAGMTPLQLAEFAFRSREFQEADGDQVSQQPYGLGKRSLDILMTMRTETLKEQELFRYLTLRLDLLLAMGRTDYAAENLKLAMERKVLPTAIAARYQVLIGGVLGDYEMMDAGLAELEKTNREAMALHQSLWVAKAFVAPPGMSFTVFGVAIKMHTKDHGDMLLAQQFELFNAMTLRGVAALELGDTKKARAILAAVVAEAGEDRYFSDRPIARRYLELLEAQKE